MILLPALAQEPLRPVSVQLTATGEDVEVANAVRDKLRGLGYVVMNTRHPEWRIVLAATKDKCGYIGALVVMDARGRSELSIHTAPDSQALAGQLAKKLETEYLAKR